MTRAKLPSFNLWPSELAHTSQASASTFTGTAQAHKYGYALRVLESGTLSKVIVPIANAGSDNTIYVTVETIDPLTGLPSGTALSTSATLAPTTGLMVIDIPPITITKGQYIAVCSNFGLYQTSLIYLRSITTFLNEYAMFPYTLTYSGTVWTRQFGSPLGGLFVNGAWQRIPGIVAVTTGAQQMLTGTSVHATLREYGAKTVLPFDALVTGIWLQKATTAGIGKWDLVIYNADTGAVIANVPASETKPPIISTTVALVDLATPVEIAKDTPLRIVAKPITTTSNTVQIHYLPTTADYVGVLDEPNNYHVTQRDSAGVWSENVLQKPLIGLILGEVGMPDTGGGGTPKSFVRVNGVAQAVA